MRCDLHVHSARSGAVDVRPFTRVASESYAEPVAVYEQARRRGMDLFTLTDHNTIAGGLELAHLPETFVSEEVSCALPGGRELHLGVFDITEIQHEEVARAFTVVPEAQTKAEFLAGLRRGFTMPAGRSGSYSRLTADVARIAAGAYLEHARLARRDGEAAWRFTLMAGMAPLLPLLPLVTACIFVHEQLFARRHDRLFRDATTRRRRRPAASGPFGPASAPTFAR